MKVIQKPTKYSVKERVKDFFNFKSRKDIVRFLQLVALAIVLPVSLFLIAQRIDLRNRAGVNVIPVRISDSQTKPISEYIWGLGFGIANARSKEEFYTNIGPDLVKRTNAKNLRFLNGCHSQMYDWRTGMMKRLNEQTGEVVPANQIMTVQEAINVAREANAKLTYEINISTTNDIDGCGNRPSFNSTVQDALDLMAKHNNDIAMYELGNEQWFRMDPKELTDRVLSYARAIRKDPRFENVTLISIGLHSTAVILRNSIQAGQATDEEKRKQVKRLVDAKCLTSSNREVKCIDAITTHLYALSGYNPASRDPWNFEGVGAYFPISNFTKVYQTARELFGTDIAPTEWNMRCFQGEDLDGPLKILPAAGTVENGIFIADNLLLMAQHGVRFSFQHSLSTNEVSSKCHAVRKDKTLTTSGKAFAFTSEIAGGQLLTTQAVNVPTQLVVEETSKKTKCNGCNEIAYILGGTFPKLEMYSAYTQDGTKLITYVVNRSKEAFTIDPDYSLRKTKVTSNTATVEYLKATNFTDTSFREQSITVSRDGTVQIPPVSITRITVNVSAKSESDNEKSPTATPSPTPRGPTKTPTPTPLGGNQTSSADFKIRIQGIGTEGTTNPAHPNRNFTITILDGNTVVSTRTINALYTNGLFVKNVSFGKILRGEIYKFKVKANNTASTISVAAKSNTPAGFIFSVGPTLPVGDVNNDDTINSTDETLLDTCIQNNCTYKQIYDLNDDGTVNSTDLQLLRRNMGR